MELVKSGKGKIAIINDLSQNATIIEAGLLLEGFFNRFIKECNRYHAATGDIPYRYSELRLQSVMLPALSSVSNAVYAEFPVTKDDQSGRRTDYLLLKEDQIHLIELKRSSINYGGRSSTIPGRIRNSWSKAYRDLQTTDLEPMFARFKQAKTISKIALMVLPTVDYSKKLNRLELRTYSEDEIMQKYSETKDLLDPHPNWIGIWLPPDSMTRDKPTKSDKFVRNPAVALIARVDTSRRTHR